MPTHHSSFCGLPIGAMFTSTTHSCPSTGIKGFKAPFIESDPSQADARSGWIPRWDARVDSQVGSTAYTLVEPAHRARDG